VCGCCRHAPWRRLVFSYVLIFCISNLCALHSLNKGLTPTPPTKRLVLSRNYSGTTNGLAKFFYVRDTRRAVGLDGFRLRHDMMMKGPGHSSSGTVFADAIAIGGYNFDVSTLSFVRTPLWNEERKRHAAPNRLVGAHAA
jgi:hypothetical protein